MPALPPLLLCPVCRQEMADSGPGQGSGRVLACPSGHRFDAARQGYFNLLTGQGTRFQADTAQMVQARADFLDAGHYDPLRRAIADAAVRSAPAARTILDAGAGTGWYLAAAAAALPAARPVALDISKFALRRAARALPGGIHLVWDVWRPLPLADGSVDLLLNVFAPRNPEEFARVLAPSGALIVVTPRPEHLRELRDLAGLLAVGGGKEEQVSAAVAADFILEEQAVVRSHPVLTLQDLRNAALMGPSAHHLDPDRLEAALGGAGTPLAVTAAFNLQVFRRRTVSAD